MTGHGRSPQGALVPGRDDDDHTAPSCFIHDQCDRPIAGETNTTQQSAFERQRNDQQRLPWQRIGAGKPGQIAGIELAYSPSIQLGSG